MTFVSRPGLPSTHRSTSATYVVYRAQNPRTEHGDTHFDRTMTTVIDSYGADPVRTVIDRILVDDEPFRTATNGLEMRNVDGVRIGTAASWFLEELNAQDSD
jgi:hypothetical protein